MFWLIYDMHDWSPEKKDISKALGENVSFRLLNGFHDHRDHPLFAIFYNVDGLRALNMGLIEVDADTLPRGVAHIRDKLKTIYGPFGNEDIQQSLIRLHAFNLARSTIEDGLSMIGLLQVFRQKLSVLGELKKWNDEIEKVSDALSSITEDLQYNKSQSLDHLIAPLNPNDE